MALFTVRAAAERLGVAYSTVKTMGSHRTRPDHAHRRRAPSLSDAEIDRLLARQQPEGRRRRRAQMPTSRWEA